MEDCKKDEKEEDCGESSDRCFKMSLDYKVTFVQIKGFSKGCSTKAVCNANEKLKICKEADGTCELNCCDSDGCNSGAMPVISAFLLVICTLVSKMCF